MNEEVRYMISVPYMRTCMRCGLTLPSVKFYSFLAERFSEQKLIRDKVCIYCREKAGETKEQAILRLTNYLNSGRFDKEDNPVELEGEVD